MEPKKFSWKERGNSFTYAWAGIKAVFRTEHNTWIHLVLTCMAMVIGFVLKISPGEFIALIIVMTMVWTAEIFNTAIEKNNGFYFQRKTPANKTCKGPGRCCCINYCGVCHYCGCNHLYPETFLNNEKNAIRVSIKQTVFQ